MIQATLPRRSAQGLDLTGLARQVMQPWSDAYESWRAGVADLVKPATTSKVGCGCETCQRDPCGCRCCVNDCDLLIEARVGENRIIPVTIENHWRRERDIELELSSWTKIGGDLQVQGAIVTETSFKLAACGEAHVVLAVMVGGGANGAVIGADSTNVAQRQFPDVDRCQVAYADLRIKGCDLRSIRLAVAVLPRDCDAYQVDCACGCC